MLNYGGAWIRVKPFTPSTVHVAHLWPLFDALRRSSTLFEKRGNHPGPMRIPGWYGKPVPASRPVLLQWLAPAPAQAFRGGSPRTPCSSAVRSGLRPGLTANAGAVSGGGLPWTARPPCPGPRAPGSRARSIGAGEGQFKEAPRTFLRRISTASLWAPPCGSRSRTWQWPSRNNRQRASLGSGWRR